MFISIEGGEGAGKSSAIKTIERILLAHEIPFVSTREPGGTPLSEQIRTLLLNKSDELMVDETELLLVFAARMQHVKTVIKPSLTAGKWVICDRFVDATYAYQGGGRQLNKEKIGQLERWCLGDFKPRYTFFLDVSIKTGMERASQRGQLDRFESEVLSFFERVDAEYRGRIEQEPERFICIDAEVDIASVNRQLEQVLCKLIKSNNQ